MFKQFFAHMEFTALPIFALWLFIAMFLLVLLRFLVFRTDRDFAQQANAPLVDGTPISSPEVKP
jgi:hypothetical protein